MEIKGIINDLFNRVEMLSAESAIAGNKINDIESRLQLIQKIIESKQKREQAAIKIASLSLCAFTFLGSVIFVFYCENIIPQGMNHTLEIANLLGKGFALLGFIGAMTTLFGGDKNQIIVTFLERLIR